MFRALIVALAMGSGAVALPQAIDYAMINELPTPSVQGPPITGESQVPTYVPSKAAASASAAAATDPVDTNDKRDLTKRDACSPYPSGYGPSTSPDTAQAFLDNPTYKNIESNAPVPQGYQLVFENLQGSTSQNGYMGYYTLQSYDTIKCQQYCDAAQSCTAFNLYITRDPTVEPGAGCDNPPSTVNYRCTLWGLPITKDTATNTGQWRDQFQIVTTASNGYVKNDPPPSYTSFTGPTGLGGAVNAPSGYIGSRMYPGPYDPGQCAAACQGTTQYDHDHPNSDGTYDACNFFVSYVLSKNNAALGTYCALYTSVWDRSYATNTGGYDGDGNYYSVSSAYSYSLTTQDSGKL